MKRSVIAILFLLLFVLLGFMSSPAAAQDPQPTQPAAVATPSDDEVNAVAKQMYCPVCENIPLDVCPTTACQEWRDLIRQQLAAGKSVEEIKEYFAVQYGDRVLAEPPRRGLNWLVYLLPPFFFLVGAGIVYNVLRSMRKNAEARADLNGVDVQSTPASNGKPGDDPYLAQLEEELRRQSD